MKSGPSHVPRTPKINADAHPEMWKVLHEYSHSSKKSKHDLIHAGLLSVIPEDQFTPEQLKELKSLYHHAMNDTTTDSSSLY